MHWPGNSTNLFVGQTNFCEMRKNGLNELRERNLLSPRQADISGVEIYYLASSKTNGNFTTDFRI